MGRRYTQARHEASERWNKEHYARITISIKKEENVLLRKAAEESGESLTQYIMNAVRARFKEEGLI